MSEREPPPHRDELKDIIKMTVNIEQLIPLKPWSWTNDDKSCGVASNLNAADPRPHDDGRTAPSDPSLSLGTIGGELSTAPLPTPSTFLSPSHQQLPQHSIPITFPPSTTRDDIASAQSPAPPKSHLPDHLRQAHPLHPPASIAMADKEIKEGDSGMLPLPPRSQTSS
jgi:hypothetical protein